MCQPRAAVQDPSLRRREFGGGARRLGTTAALRILVLCLTLTCHAMPAQAEPATDSGQTPTAAAAPSAWQQAWRVLTLRDYNTRVVLLGTVALGTSGGVVGVFMLLRKRSLLGDVVSHSALPGIALAFVVLEIIEPGTGKSLPGLLVGATLGGLVGVLCTHAVRRWTRVKDDAALAIVLSVLFGLGIALFTVVQRLPTGNSAGLSHFIYGKAASMQAEDAAYIAGAAVLALILSALLVKEFSLVAFDERFASAEGWPVFWLDLVLMGLVVVISVIGLQSVGLLLVVALLIIPAAAAGFWTERLGPMLWISAGLGGVSSLLGVTISAVFPRVATGATIVLCGSVAFGISLLVGVRRGVLRRLFVLWQVRQRTERQHLLRGFYEAIAGERGAASIAELTETHVDVAALLQQRRWTAAHVGHLLQAAERAGLVRAVGGNYALTASGAATARQVVRNHRLWELYLIHFADIAPSHVDRDADDIEHVLDDEMLELLEQRLGREYPEPPRSPHAVRS